MNEVKQKINVSLCISMGLITWIFVTPWRFMRDKSAFIGKQMMSL